MDGDERERVTHLVVMGVSGSGKTTLASALAEHLGRPFLEGDDLHPPANVEAMRSGRALTDADRLPWLRAVRRWMEGRAREGRAGVVACSALRRGYRDLLRGDNDDVVFLFLDVPRTELERRLRERRGHFMPVGLLDSQLAALEPLEPDEPGLRLPLRAGAPGRATPPGTPAPPAGSQSPTSPESCTRPDGPAGPAPSGTAGPVLRAAVQALRRHGVVGPQPGGPPESA